MDKAKVDRLTPPRPNLHRNECEQVPTMAGRRGRSIVGFLFLSLLAPPAPAHTTRCGVAESGGTVKQARLVLLEAASAADLLEDGHARCLVLHPIVAALTQAGYTEEALRVARKSHEICDPQVFLVTIVTAQARFGDVPGAFQTVSSIENDWLRAVALATIASAQAGAGETLAALQTAYSISEEQIQTKVEILARLGWWQGVRGKISSAAVTLDHAENLVASMHPLAAQVDGCLTVAAQRARIGDEVGWSRLFERSLQLALDFQDETQKTAALYRIGRAQTLAKDFGGALRTAEQIDDDVSRDGVLRTILERQRPIRNLDNLRAASRLVALMRTDLVKDQALAMIAHDQAIIESLSAALQSVEQIRDQVFREVVRESVLSPPRPVAELASLCVGSSLGATRVNPSCTDEQLNEVSYHLAREGLYPLAVETARATTSPDSNASTLRAIAGVQASAGDWQGALAWARDEPAPPSKSYLLLGIAEGMLSCLKPEVTTYSQQDHKH